MRESLKPICASATIALALASALGAQTGGKQVLPSARDVLERYVKAIGGRDAYLEMKSLYLRGEATHPEFKATMEAFAKAPNKIMVVMQIGGVGAIREGCDGSVVWSEDPANGVREITGAEREQAVRDADFYEDIQLEKHLPDLKVVREGRIDERRVYVLEGSLPNGLVERLYFDTESGLLVRRDSWDFSQTPATESQFLMEDYRPMGELKFPFRLRDVANQMVITLIEAKPNVDIPDSRFTKPEGP